MHSKIIFKNIAQPLCVIWKINRPGTQNLTVKNFRRSLQGRSHVVPCGSPLSVQVGTACVSAQVSSEGAICVVVNYQISRNEIQIGPCDKLYISQLCLQHGKYIDVECKYFKPGFMLGTR